MQPDRQDPDDPEEPDHRQSADERAWRAIVENYGPRPAIDDLPGDLGGSPGDLPDDGAPPRAEGPRGSGTPGASGAANGPFGGRFGNLTAGGGHVEPIGEDEDDPFVADEEGYDPPPPPPLPKVSPDRMLAWVGVLGTPVVLLVALVLSVSLPSWLGYLLVAGFVGGFAYLVYSMPRGPRDPWDDGAQV